MSNSINQMIQIANKIKKSKKEDCQAIIKMLVEKYPDNTIEFAKLYNYFMPPAPAKPKTAFHWVAKAASRDKTKENLLYVYVDKQNIVATDGHRLHVAKNTDNLSPGYYCPRTMDYVYAPDYMQFPDYCRVVPSVDSLHHTVTDIEVIQNNDKNATVCYKLRRSSGDNDGPTVNKKYYDDCLSYGVDDVMFENNITPVLVTNGDCYAVLMPMRCVEQ